MIAPGEIPPELADLIAHATERDLGSRVPTADALRRALAPWVRSVRTPAHPQHKATVAASELHQLIVLAPRAVPETAQAGARGQDGLDTSRGYLAEAVHEELLARLSRRARVRVLPRVEAPLDPGATIVSLVTSDALALTLSRDGIELLVMRLPLSSAVVASAADAAANAIAAALTLDEPPRTGSDVAALDLLLRGISTTQRNVMQTANSIRLLEEADKLSPGNPRVWAALAIAYARTAFFMANSDRSALERATALARAAVAAAPELVESQLAMGHVALHRGDSVLAAGHFRVAIACAPVHSEAHELLGRLLLEAGHHDAALERLEYAIAISPQRRGARWEVARAHALDARWADYDRVLVELAPAAGERALARARIMWWRGDFAGAKSLHEVLRQQRVYDAGLIEYLYAVYYDNNWSKHRDALLANGRDHVSPDMRRRTFTAQLAAEGAGFAGDVDVCNDLLEHAVASGLIDLHWLDRCPMLAPARGSTRFQAVRARVKARADAIFDALYGDYELATTETELAPSALAESRHMPRG